jgi:hypothetical protein
VAVGQVQLSRSRRDGALLCNGLQQIHQRMTQQSGLVVRDRVSVVAVAECVVKAYAMHRFTYGGVLGSSVR